MIAPTLLLAFVASAACPVQPANTLPELVGSWHVLMIGGLDRPKSDSMHAESTIAVELDGCLLREQLLAPGYGALVLWGANGGDGTTQRVFVHSQHGRFGIYQGRRVGAELLLRQQNLSSQPDSIIVENDVAIRDRDHFAIASRLSNDRGRSWIALSRWEYVRAIPGRADAHRAPDTVEVHNGAVTLRGLLWRPEGRGPFPAILLNHGSGRTPEELKRIGRYEDQADTLGPVFARHGYVFLFLFRRGVGLSTALGRNALDSMNDEQAAHGMSARNALQLRLLEGREMGDAQAALAFLRKLADVDPHDVGLVGHSFGGSLTFLMAEREPDLRAVVIFSATGYSWDRSPELRARLLAAAPHVTSPMFFIHAANDYSISPGKAMDARLSELGKTSRVKIYPPIGRTAEDGHAFPFLGVSEWEPDVFAFLDSYMRR